jgi:hypothetical protein
MYHRTRWTLKKVKEIPGLITPLVYILRTTFRTPAAEA